MLPDFRSQKANRHTFSALTVYDYPTARIMDECGLDFLLVGDSLGMVVLGYEDTTRVTMAEMEHHLRAVRRGVKVTPVVADLPYGSYEGKAEALRNSERLLEAGADAVKLEGGFEVADTVRALVETGIAVVGHIGMLPQRVAVEGGYTMKGKTDEEAARLRSDALALEAAGVSAVVLELISPPLATEITRALSIPTIGIGSGDQCDGQIRVLHDIIGLFPWFRPRFAKQKADMASEILRAVEEFQGDVLAARSKLPG